eukprot:02185.XXX_35338_35478_1 [CDS] Oithona nana genome sequencing.
MIMQRCVNNSFRSVIASRHYFTDNLGCVIGSTPDRNSDGFKVSRHH